MGLDANPNIGLVHYIMDAKAHFSPSISVSKTLRERLPSSLVSVCVFLELIVPWCVIEEGRKELVETKSLKCKLGSEIYRERGYT